MSAAELVLQDNGAFMYGNAPHCPDCTRVLDDAWVDPEPSMPPPSFDISTTSDNCIVVSDAFVAACAELDGPRFVPLFPGWSVLHVDRVVRVEQFDSRVRTGPVCQVCDGPRYQVRSGPLRLADGEKVGQGFSRTDLAFGDTADFGRTRPIRLHPVIVVHGDTIAALKVAGLSGIHGITMP